LSNVCLNLVDRSHTSKHVPLVALSQVHSVRLFTCPR
jgi:hypothetical protein